MTVCIDCVSYCTSYPLVYWYHVVEIMPLPLFACVYTCICISLQRISHDFDFARRFRYRLIFVCLILTCHLWWWLDYCNFVHLCVTSTCLIYWFRVCAHNDVLFLSDVTLKEMHACFGLLWNVLRLVLCPLVPVSLLFYCSYIYSYLFNISCISYDMRCWHLWNSHRIKE